MLVVPWPLTSCAPTGMVHCTEVALAGIDASVYVNTLEVPNGASPQKAVWITSITLGVAGLSLVTDSVLGPLVPQPFVAVTDIDPEVKPAG